jgi:hypothetical protein
MEGGGSCRQGVVGVRERSIERAAWRHGAADFVSNMLRGFRDMHWSMPKESGDCEDGEICVSRKMLGLRERDCEIVSGRAGRKCMGT